MDSSKGPNPFLDGPVAILVDTDVIVHKVSRASEKQVRWPDGVWSWFARESEADLISSDYMFYLKTRLQADKVVMNLSSEANFRHQVFPAYKCERNNPESYGPILKKYLRNKYYEEYDTFLIDGLEADDVLGILATSPGYLKGYTKVICTIDKDLDTVPGWHYGLDKKELYYVTDEEADYKFYTQCLTGDRTDGIPGCPGFGDKTAQKLLDKTDKCDWWSMIVEQYKKKDLDEAYALTMARLVRILRTDDWNSETKTPILWEPKS